MTVIFHLKMLPVKKSLNALPAHTARGNKPFSLVWKLLGLFFSKVLESAALGLNIFDVPPHSAHHCSQTGPVAAGSGWRAGGFAPWLLTPGLLVFRVHHRQNTKHGLSSPPCPAPRDCPMRHVMPSGVRVPIFKPH